MSEIALHHYGEHDLTKAQKNAEKTAENLKASANNDTKKYSKANRRAHYAQIKALLRETLTNEAVQGFLKIFFASHLAVKLFWTLSLLVANGLCAYLVVQTVLAYFSYGVSTTSRVINENPALFPKITICNNNQFTTAYSVEFIKGRIFC